LNSQPVPKKHHLKKEFFSAEYKKDFILRGRSRDRNLACYGWFYQPMWWSSKGVWRAPWAAEIDEGMEASWKALASKGRWKRW